MEYVNYVKSKAHLGSAKKAEAPVLSDEDETFLKQVASGEGQPEKVQVQDLPVAGETQVRDAQVAILDGAQNVPLPSTPDRLSSEPKSTQSASAGDHILAKLPRPNWSWMRRDSREVKTKSQKDTAESLMAVAEKTKSSDGKSDADDEAVTEEAKKEQEDMASVLEQLNLAAINNRVFSISDETNELLRKFNLVFKDLVNGVPTAYRDLEALLKDGDKTLQKSYNSLPSFLQKLIAQLPLRMKESVAPQMMAAAAAAAQGSAPTTSNAAQASTTARKSKGRFPALKDIVGKPGAIANMLKSIITFLRARFPLFLGMNVIWSLALFVLLFVLWYCHKRGKEVRLEKERDLTEQEMAQLGEEKGNNLFEQPTTTAPEGASIEEVREGINEVRMAREAALEEQRQEEQSAVPDASVPRPAEQTNT